ncbi:hypothetical protein MHYP_G00167040 [Metynnis hypsauchen]
MNGRIGAIAAASLDISPETVQDSPPKKIDGRRRGKTIFDEIPDSAGYLLQQALLDTEFPEYMGQDLLHCTVHVHEGPDEAFEARFFQTTPPEETVHCTHLYWGPDWVAAGVQLNSDQLDLFKVVDSVPHISLGRANPSSPWKDVGPWMVKASTSSWWGPTDTEGVEYCSVLHSWRRPLGCSVRTVRGVQPIMDQTVKVQAPQLTEEVERELAEVPECLWARDKNDVGLIKGCAPVVIIPKSNYRPKQNQYPLRPEALEGIRPVFEALLEAGVVVPCPNSPVRTPIFPVKKPGRDEWRFVQDLQAVNAAMQARAPEVPNPHTILSQIPPNTTHYTVVDLANALFSVPVHPDSQYWFSFSFKGKTWTFSWLCQGYCESPTIFNAALRDSLESLSMPDGVALLHYVDDLAVCAPSRSLCEQASLALLRHLAKEGHKASKNKLQWCKEEVVFLGHILKGDTCTLAVDRTSAIVKIPKPNTKK